MVSCFDNMVGRIVRETETSGIAGKTIIFVTSDNGPHAEDGHSVEFFNSNGVLRGMKRDLYEGGIRVPLVVYWKGHIRKGSVSSHICGFQDYLPTFCDIAGIEIPEHTDGLSFLPALKGDSQPAHDYLYWEFTEGGPKQALRKDDWKLLRFPHENRTELYNLVIDPSENYDLSSQYPVKLGQLSELMEKAHVNDPLFPLLPHEGAFKDRQE